MSTQEACARCGAGNQCEVGVAEVLHWVEEDPGLLIVPSRQFTAFLCFASARNRGSP